MQFLHIKVYQNFCAFYIFLTLSGPGGGGGGYKAWMTKFKNFLLYDVQTWWLLVFIFKTWSNKILEKFVNQRGCCCSFLIKASQNFWKWKTFSLFENSWNRPFWKYIPTLQVTEYLSQPRIHLINSSNWNCHMFFQNSIFTVFTKELISELNTRPIRASRMNFKKVYWHRWSVLGEKEWIWTYKLIFRG